MMKLPCLNAVVSVPEVCGDDGSCQSAKHNNTDPLLRIVGFLYVMHFRPVSRIHYADRDVPTLRDLHTEISRISILINMEFTLMVVDATSVITNVI
jgi:hypothetical protein